MAKTNSMCLHQEILNHCFDDVEQFMGRLQQTAEAQSILKQRKKKRSRRSKKKADQDGERIGTILSSNYRGHSFAMMVKGKVSCRRRVEAGNCRQRLNIGFVFCMLEAGQQAGCQKKSFG